MIIVIITIQRDIMICRYALGSEVGTSATTMTCCEDNMTCLFQLWKQWKSMGILAMVRSNFFRPKYLSPPNAKLFPRIFSVTEESLRRITLSGILGMIGMTFGPLAPILGHLDHLHQFPEGQMAESPARSNQLTSWIHISQGSFQYMEVIVGK